MIHEMLRVGPLSCNCSIFGDEQSREGLVVDPGDNISGILAILEKHQLKVKAIFVTHAHIDHIGGAAKLKAATGAPVYMNASDQGLYDHLELQAAWLGMPTPERTSIDVDAREGGELKIGSSDFQIIHTPGHTQGSSCLWNPSENKLVAGDVLFRDSIGRTDLPGGSSRMMMSSLKTKIMEMPEQAMVIPGHGAITTIGREKQFNPFLQSL
jgi:glyoxylase-like metal-dependent hydrolase (beta-lactamase superfamily II)